MPSSPGYIRDYKQEARTESPKRRMLRKLRKRARYLMEKLGKVRPHDGMDVDHVDPLDKGGSNKRSNLRVRTASANRSYPRTRTAQMR